MASVQEQQQQQHQEQQDKHDAVLTVKAMEQAVSRIFQNSFDADSKTCLVTLMRVLDNILHKPADDRVRTIRVSNAAFAQKVARRPGGVDFLLACGFTRQSAPPALGATVTAAAAAAAATAAVEQDVLVLHPQQEKQSRLLMARRLLRQRAIQDLHCQPEELPPLREPPKIVVSSSSSLSTDDTNNNNNNNNTFNPYVGHWYDGLSAAVGTQLGPPANHVSRTTVQLQALQNKKAQLEAAAAQALGTDRRWRAYAAGEIVPIAATFTTTTSTRPNQPQPPPQPPSDAALLARRAKAQQAERQQREQGGFTTAAMRQVKALQSKKVYSHVQITIVFADQSKVTGKFLPHETIGRVVQSLRQHCFLVSPNNNNNNDWQVDLYVAPPRRLLPHAATLEQEGLVPAAKIFASWKVGHAPAPGQAFLQPHLFPKQQQQQQQAQGLEGQQQQQADNIGTTAFPTAKPIVPAPAAVAPTATATAQPKKKKESREELMLQRMMGKK